MINYIRSELHRIFHKRSLYIYYLMMTIILIVMHKSADTGLKNGLSPSLMEEMVIGWLAVYPILFGIQIYLTVYKDDKNNGLMANALTNDVSKANYIIGKLIVQCICVIVTLTYLTLLYMIAYTIISGGFSSIEFAHYLDYVVYTLLICLMMAAYSSVSGILYYTKRIESVHIVAIILLATPVIDDVIMSIFIRFGLFIPDIILRCTPHGAFGRAMIEYSSNNRLDFISISILAGYIIAGVVVTLHILKKKDVVVD